MRFLPVDAANQYFIPIKDAAGKLQAMRVTPVDAEDQYAFPVKDAAGKLVMVRGASATGPYCEITVSDTDMIRRDMFTISLALKNDDGSPLTGQYVSVTLTLVDATDVGDDLYSWNALNTPLTAEVYLGWAGTATILKAYILGGAEDDTLKIQTEITKVQPWAPYQLGDYLTSVSEEIAVDGNTYYLAIAGGPDIGDYWYRSNSFNVRGWWVTDYWNSNKYQNPGTDPYSGTTGWNYTNNHELAYKIKDGAVILKQQTDTWASIPPGKVGWDETDCFAIAQRFIMLKNQESTIDGLEWYIAGYSGYGDKPQTYRVRIYSGGVIGAGDLIAYNDSLSVNTEQEQWVPVALTNVAV
jgi:hypothetical protein